MIINSCVISHPGKIREKNEDSFLYYDLISESLNKFLMFENRSNTELPVLLGVFDGMGGASAGEVASRISAVSFRSMATHLSGSADIERALYDMCIAANGEICREMVRSSKKTMGSTASVLCFEKDRFVLCNIGDSPIFIYRYGKLTEISYEHTDRRNVEMLSGAHDEKVKYKLTQHLGIDPEEMLIEPNIVPGQLKAGDRFVICSDGITDMVDRARIAEILDEGQDAGKAAKALFDEASENGGADNITVMCVDVIG